VTPRTVWFLPLAAALLFADCECGATPCTAGGCPAGEQCVDGACVPDPGDGDGDGGSDANDAGSVDAGSLDAGTCGDGSLSPGETCDDGNATGADGCSSACVLEPDSACPVPGQPCVRGAVCGDGRLGDLEQCDDRNLTPGDGCGATCAVESGWACPIVGVACVAAACGDGLLAGLEQCDDGNAAASDGCGATCALEEGHVCATPGAPCRATVCGDQVTEGTEQCDDGNHDLGDGCDTRCHSEPRCTDGVCTAVCGDRIRLPQEACDDGNTRPGDGCSASCEVEPGFACADEPPAAQATLAIPIVYRDFKPWTMDGGHIDFNHLSGSEKGIVASHLGTDDKPVYGAHASTDTTHGAGPFDQWYRDVPQVNLTIVDTLVVTRTASDTYVFDSTDFFPIDGKGWWTGGATEPYPGYGNASQHNFNFTSELRYWFTYAGGESLSFIGDDDVFVFINGRLVVDLGGVHNAEAGSITLDAAAAADAGLTAGGIYEAAVFQAERNVVESHYKLTLKGFNATRSNCLWRCGDGIATRYEACDDGVNDGGYGGCMPGCLLRGPYCGDRQVDSAFGEECDDGVNLGLDGGCPPGCGPRARCGDGLVQPSLGEECDDSNVADNDGCDHLCRVEIH
jgi:fibro-slime domain-containing protein